MKKAYFIAFVTLFLQPFARSIDEQVLITFFGFFVFSAFTLEAIKKDEAKNQIRKKHLYNYKK